MAGRSMRGHDASVLWRSLREIMALSAAFLDGDHVEVIYPRHRELRAWPYWEVLELVRAEPAVMPDDAMAGRITQALGGHVVSTSIGPAGRAAALWTQDSYPPWYHVVIWSGSDPPDYRSLSARPSRQIRVVAARGLAVRIGSGWTNMPDRSPATAAHGVKPATRRRRSTWSSVAVYGPLDGPAAADPGR